MAAIDIGKFGPVFFDGRRIDLPLDASLGIANVRLGSERLEPVAPPAIVAGVWTPYAPPITRRPYIYRTGAHSNDQARMWAFDASADIERTPIRGDDEDRLVLTDWQYDDQDPLALSSTAPKTVSKTIAAATPVGAFEPDDFNYLGVPAPTVAPVLTGVTPSTAIVITELAVGEIMLYRTFADIPNWRSSGAPGDGDSQIQLPSGENGEHIFGGFIPGQRMVVTEIVDSSTVRIAAPNADRAIGDLNVSSSWRFTQSDAATQIICTWRLPKIATATIKDHKLQVNDVLRVTQVTVNPSWFSGTTLNLAPSSGLERLATPTTGTIEFIGKVSCVVEPPGLPVVYDNDGVLIATAAPSPLAWNISSFASGGTDSRTVSAIPYGGLGPFTYSWAWTAGGTGLSLAGTTTPTVTVSRVYLQGDNASYGGTLRVTITDSLSTVVTADVPVEVVVTPADPGAGGGGGGGGEPALAATLSSSALTGSASSISAGGNLDAACTVTAVGGRTPYSYNWSFAAGGTGLTILNGTTSAATVRRAYAQNEANVYTGTLRCTVTDANNNSVSADASVTLTVTGPMTITPSPDGSFYDVKDASKLPGGNGVLTDYVELAVTGGVGPFTYTWSFTDPLYAFNKNLVMVVSPNNRCTVSRSFDGDSQKKRFLFTVQCVVTDTDNGRTSTLFFPGDYLKQV
jgi:hypothetical protein